MYLVFVFLATILAVVLGNYAKPLLEELPGQCILEDQPVQHASLRTGHVQQASLRDYQATTASCMMLSHF